MSLLTETLSVEITNTQTPCEGVLGVSRPFSWDLCIKYCKLLLVDADKGEGWGYTFSLLCRRTVLVNRLWDNGPLSTGTPNAYDGNNPSTQWLNTMRIMNGTLAPRFASMPTPLLPTMSYGADPLPCGSVILVFVSGEQKNPFTVSSLSVSVSIAPSLSPHLFLSVHLISHLEKRNDLYAVRFISKEYRGQLFVFITPAARRLR